MNFIEIRNKTIAARVVKKLMHEFRSNLVLYNRLKRVHNRTQNPIKEKIRCDRYYKKRIYKHKHKPPSGEMHVRRMQCNRNNRIILLQILNPTCIKCGYDSDYRALQIDHINGGGNTDRKSHGLSSMYRKYINNSELAREKLQVLCANCNVIKRIEKRESWYRIVT